LNLSSSWALALLSALGRQARLLDWTAASAVEREQLAGCYGLGLLLSPSAVVPPREGSPWEWDTSFRAAAKGFVEALPEDERAANESLLRSLQLVEVTSSDENAGELLRLLPNALDENAAFMSFIVRTLCFCREGFAKVVWEKLHDGLWWKACTNSLPPKALSVLSDGLTELQGKTGGEWHAEMPYLWLSALDAHAEDAERSECLLAATIASSLAAMTAAPIQRLMMSEQLPKVRQQLLKTRDNLTRLLDVADRRFTGPLRDILATLASL